MSKRGAASAPALPPKKARKEDHHINMKTMEIVAALKLQREGLSDESERKLLAKVAPYALSVPQDKRHPMQERVVGFIENELLKLSASFKVSVTECTQAESVVDAAHSALLAKIEAIEATMNEKRACMKSKKEALAMTADSLRTAKRQVLEAQDAGSGEAEAAARAEAALSVLDAVPSLEEAVPEVEEFLKKMPITFEESLRISLPMSLSKGQEERHDFDKMAVEQFKGLVAKTKEELNGAMEAGRAAREARQASLTKAQDGLAAVQQELLLHAAAYMASSEAVEASSQEEAESKQHMVRTLSELRKARQAKDNAEAELEAHESSTMATFSTLKLLQAPPPPSASEAPVVPEELVDTSLGAAPVVDAEAAPALASA